MVLGFALCCLCTSETALPQCKTQKAPSGVGANVNSESFNSKFDSIVLKAEKASHHRFRYGVTEHSKEPAVTKGKEGGKAGSKGRGRKSKNRF